MCIHEKQFFFSTKSVCSIWGWKKRKLFNYWLATKINIYHSSVPRNTNVHFNIFAKKKKKKYFLHFQNGIYFFGQICAYVCTMAHRFTISKFFISNLVADAAEKVFLHLLDGICKVATQKERMLWIWIMQLFKVLFPHRKWRQNTSYVMY